MGNIGRRLRIFYQERVTMSIASDFGKHDEYASQAMGNPIQLTDRIWSAIKASIISPFNGFPLYPNVKRTLEAEEFMSYIAFDSSLREDIHRIHIPTLLVFGNKDLIAPVEVGEFIYDKINTDEADKTLLVLEHSRHGAENGDIEIFQRAITDFVEKYQKK